MKTSLLMERLEEVEVAEREVPRARVVVESGVLVEAFADETKLLVRRREAFPQERAAVGGSARRQEDERVRSAPHLYGGPRDERAHGRRLVGCRDEVREEPGRD